MSVDRPGCQVISLNGDHCIASWHNVAVSIWNRTPDMPAIRRIGYLQRRLSKLYSRGGVGLCLCDTSMAVPSLKARKEIGQWIRDNPNRGNVNVLVIDGTGFWASSVRAFLGSLSVIVGKETHSIFEDLTEAARFLQPHFAVGAGTVQDLTVLVYQLKNDMSEARDRCRYFVAK